MGKCKFLLIVAIVIFSGCTEQGTLTRTQSERFLQVRDVESITPDKVRVQALLERLKQ